MQDVAVRSGQRSCFMGKDFTDETIEGAIQAVAQADLTVVVGTSLQVYPFAGLVDYSQQVLVINKDHWRSRMNMAC